MDAANPATPPGALSPQGPPPAVTPWPRTAQLATVFLLGVATTLLAVHACRGLRWGTRPTELERNTFPYHIDLNRADRAELLQVPGVGYSLAQRIEDYRRQHGAFQNLGDLRQVQGIGPTTLERLRPWISVQTTGMDPPAGSYPPTRGNNPETSDKAGDGRKGTSNKEALLTSPIDINQAAAAELQRLPGVGPRRAQLIIEERQKRPFMSIEELRRVPGIGPKTLQRLRPYITFESGPMRMVTMDGP